MIKQELIQMEEREKREVRYSISRKLLDLMLKNGFITEDEYKKIDQLNRETFSPELSKVYA
mgnify:CR=1 FL=1